MPAARSFVVALVVLAAGCAPHALVRTADVLPPASVGGQLSMVPYAYTHGASSVGKGGEREQVTGNAAYRIERDLDVAPAVGNAYTSFADYGLQVGLPGRLELGASLGYGQGTLELRHGLLDEDRGAPLSLAPAVAGALGFFHRRPPTVRVGFDASRRLGSVEKRNWMTVLGGVYVSRGTRTANLLLGKDYGFALACTEGWPGTPCASGDPRSRAYVDFESTYTALAVPVGLAYQNASERGHLRTLSLGVVAHVPLALRTAGAHCAQCSSELRAGPAREGPGLLVMVGFSAGRLDGDGDLRHKDDDPEL